MRVVEVGEFGGPEVLRVREAPDPVPGRGKVVINVAAADVLYLDTQLRAGWGEFFSLAPPYVPGNGVTGPVVAVGDGVDERWQGRWVVARTGRVPDGAGPMAPTGGYAERVAVPVDRLVAVPPGLGERDALALLHDGATALQVTKRVRITPGDWALITAAGGSLGVVLIQLARAAGARVIAAARGERKLELVRRVGADVAVDYSEPGWEQRVRSATGEVGVNVVFDGAGGGLGGDAFRATVPGARFSSYGAASGEFARVTPEEATARGVTLIGISDQEADAEAPERLVERALHEAAAGRLKPFIGQTFPLKDAADAHAAIAARTTLGKTLLVTDSEELR